MAAEVTGNLFFVTKKGFKAHVQVKQTIEEGTQPTSVLDLLTELETGVETIGGKAENAFSGQTGGARNPNRLKDMGDAAHEAFGAKQDMGDGQCPNGCGPRPLVPAGVSRKTGKAYNAFYGECRTCGYKGR